MSVSVGSAVGYLDLDIRGFLDGLRSAQAAANENVQNLQKSFGDKMNDIADSMQSVGKNLSLKVTAPIVAIGTAALMAGSNFEESMNAIKSQTGMAADEIEGLGASFRAMALSCEHSAFSALEVAAAFSDIAVAGQDAEHATEIMRSAMVLATAVGDDLKDTAYFLGNYLMKVGKDSSYAEKYINLFAAASQKTNIPLSTLQDYLFRTNASLQAAGISGTEATAVFSKLYQAGIRGAQAYSGMNTVIRDLISPSENLTAIMDELGVAAFDLEDANRNVLDVLFELADAVEESGDALLRHNLLQELGTDMGTQFADELFRQRDVLRDLIPELYEISEATDGTGKAFEMAATRQESLASQMAQLKAVLLEFSLQISDVLMPHAKQLVGVLKDLLEWFSDLPEPVKSVAIYIAAFAAAVGPLLIVLATLIKSVTTIVTFLGKLKIAITATKLYLGKLAVAMGAKGALGVAIAGLKIALAGLGKAFIAVWVAATGPIGLTIIAIAALAAAIWYFWDDIVEFGEWLIKEWAEIWDGIKEATVVFWNWFTTGWSEFGSEIATLWEAVWNWVADLLKETWEGIWDLFAQIWENIKFFFDRLGEAIPNWFNELWENAKKFFAGIWDWMVNWASRFMEIGRSIVEGVWRGIQNMAAWFTNQITRFFTGIVDNVKWALRMNSPSQVFADEVGKWIPAGIALGFEQAMPAAIRDMQSALNAGMGILSAGNVAVNYGFAPARGRSGGSGGWGQDGDSFGGQQNAGGNTYNFYSPEPIDAAQARREIEQMHRTMAFNV